MTIKRIGVLSAGKLAGALYAAIGLIMGVILALVSLVGGAAAVASDEPGGAMFGAIFGIGAVIILPLLYGCLGFLATAVTAALYNGIAGLVGGLELDVE